MLSDEEKTNLTNRLRRIAGQVTGVQRMLDEDAYCVDILTQIAAASGALGKVGQKILESHIKSCVSEGMQSSNDKQRAHNLEELILLFNRYCRVSD